MARSQLSLGLTHRGLASLGWLWVPVGAAGLGSARVEWRKEHGAEWELPAVPLEEQGILPAVWCHGCSGHRG